MNHSMRLVARVLNQSKKYWIFLAIIFVLNICAIPLVLLKPLALKILIDSGFGNVPVPNFIASMFPDGYTFTFGSVVGISVALIIGIALLENLYIIAVWMLNTYTGEKLVLNFRTALFNHVQRLSLIHHDSVGTSDSLYRIQYDTSAVKSFLINNLSPLITSSITLVAMLIVMFSINMQFALIICCILPLLVLLIRKSTKKLKKDWKVVKENESRAMSVINEALGALRLVKSFGKEESESQRFTRRADKAIEGQMKVARTGSLFYLAVGMIFAVATAVFMYVGAFAIQSGEMTLGELTLLIAYVAQIYGPLEKITRNINDIQSSLTSLERAYSIMDKEKEVVEDSSHVELRNVKGKFTFENVSFSYHTGKPALQDANLNIMPGDRVGIIGSTGSGKSTFLNLLSRFYDPASGKITLDGRDIKSISLKSYREQFSYVFQEQILFSNTIAENIAYGRPDANQSEIIAAAKHANAHDFIMKSADGYDTLVGERGMQLSGGERQRISIARAFLKNSPVLILDEPTSAVDVQTEQLIMDAIERLMRDRNTFLVTHRLDTLKMCNVVIHIEDGRIIDVIRDPEPGDIERKRSYRYSFES